MTDHRRPRIGRFRSVGIPAILAAVAVIAGCVGSPSVSPASPHPRIVPDALLMAGWDHDHADPAEHRGSSFGIQELSHVRYATDGIQSSLSLLPDGRIATAGNL